MSVPPAAAAPLALSPNELARYSRHLLLRELGVEGQQRLKAARILVVGLGGLGSPVALYLAAAGVGTLGLADFDHVAVHNLQRQIVHDTPSVGQTKLASAAARLRALNPHVALELHEAGITPANALALIARYDVVVDGTDQFGVRYLLNDACVLARRPLVHGSVFTFSGQLTVFDAAAGGPCLRCLFPEPPTAGTVPNCGEAGVLGALCGVIGSLQALEAVKLVTGIGEPLRGRVFSHDALAAQGETLRFARVPGCAVCGANPSITRLVAERYTLACDAPPPSLPDAMPASPDDVPLEISVAETQRLLTQTPEAVHLIDVREPFEVEIARLPGAEHIPMRRIPEALATLPRDRWLLVHCHHGGRSLRVTEWLRAQGLPRVSNVAGGIDAWSEEIDPTLRRY